MSNGIAWLFGWLAVAWVNRSSGASCRRYCLTSLSIALTCYHSAFVCVRVCMSKCLFVCVCVCGGGCKYVCLGLGQVHTSCISAYRHKDVGNR